MHVAHMLCSATGVRAGPRGLGSSRYWSLCGIGQMGRWTNGEPSHSLGAATSVRRYRIFNEGHHPAQGPVHPLRYFAPLLSLALSCLMRHVSAWPSMNSPSAMAAAAGATCSVPFSVTFW
jgi:hypothetical protein